MDQAPLTVHIAIPLLLGTHPQWPLSGTTSFEKKTVVWISVVQGLCLAVNLGMFCGRVTYISIIGASVVYIAITFRDFGEAGLMLLYFKPLIKQ